MSNPTGPCGACGETVEKVLKQDAVRPDSRWQHVNLDTDCNWGHPARPGVHLRAEEPR